MTDAEIEALSHLVKVGEVVYWIADRTARQVVSVSANVHDSEPGKVAWLKGPPSGQYIALYNAELSDFIRAEVIRA